MTNKPTHTPTRLESILMDNGYTAINAAFIVRAVNAYAKVEKVVSTIARKNGNDAMEYFLNAVNAHEELLVAVKSMRLYIDTFSEESKTNFRAGGNGEYVDALIAKAEGK